MQKNHPDDIDINDIYIERNNSLEDIYQEDSDNLDNANESSSAPRDIIKDINTIALQNTLRCKEQSSGYNFEDIGTQKEYKKKIFKLVIIISLFSIYIGGYAGFLLFSNKSVETIINLTRQKADLDFKILQNREENTRLQKQLLELRELE